MDTSYSRVWIHPSTGIELNPVRLGLRIGLDDTAQRRHEEWRKYHSKTDMWRTAQNESGQQAKFILTLNPC